MKKMDYVEIAKLCHKVNKEYCASLGDHSQSNWEDAQEWQKQSAIKGVEYHLTTENAAPEDSHNSWLVEKVANGWKYGPEKDVEKKEHPCMVEYEKLPVDQQAKDYIFKAICDFFKS
jgi:hypothetical protein